MMQLTIARLKIGRTFNINTNTADDRLLYGLHAEVWRIIFSHLRAKELCRCCQVSKAWCELVISLDTTRWRDLYLEQKGSRRWRHPNWPNENNSKLKAPWKELYRQRYKLSKLWMKNNIQASCTTRFLYNRQKEYRVLNVGRSKTYVDLRTALQDATPFTKIRIHPGVYQDITLLSLRFPVEIIGVGDVSDVLLVMQIDVRCSKSLKLENVTLKPMYPRARWRGTSAANLKVSTSTVVHPERWKIHAKGEQLAKHDIFL